MNWLTRKKLILISSISLVAFLALVSRKILFSICYTHNSACIGSVNYLILILMFGVSIFTPSLIIFFVKQETFESWRRITFTYYLAVYLLILVFVPWYGGDEFLHVQKDIAEVAVSFFYVIFSFILILYKSFQKGA